MKASEKRAPTDIPLHIRNDAAAWIMQLHASDRAPHVDAALREWLAQSEAHREAFEIAGDMWNAGSTLPVSFVGRIASRESRERVQWRRPALIATAFACCLVLAGVIYQSRGHSLTTALGEQRTLTLDDGSRVTLNTATRLMVSYDDRVRRMVLEQGEALFEVARDPQRPFVVSVADRQVTALGTAFIVRHDSERTAVTLVEGKVSVAPLGSSKLDAGELHPVETVLRPGERLTFEEHARPRLDRPPLESATAWKRGQAAFQNTPLPDAIAEMNRYSKTKLVIGDATAAATRVSGIFRVGESETFALALLNTYPLKTVEKRNALVIYGAGRASE